jgi:imidazole glycerol phosphate synthase glutamine amidotransferase subunit
MKPGLIDYGGGNLQSVRNAVRALGHDPVLVQSEADLAEVDALVYPGQGAFADCMNALNRQGLTEPLKQWILADRPYFGICVGYQVLFEGGEENPGVPGLGVLRGQVVRFPSEPGLKVPHMGWNNVNPAHPDSAAWAGLGESPFFYFVHSYYPAPLEAGVIAGTTNYAGRDFAAAVQRGRMIATQFHPEKSQATGLRLLENFLSQCA